MSRLLPVAIAAAALAAAVGGCAEEMQGTTRPLGDVDYALAFETSQEVLSDYFSIASADARTGVIRTRPRMIDNPQDRLLLSGAPARQIATLTLRPQGNEVHATLSVLIQQRGTETFGAVARTRENYSGVPDQTPAELEGATTPEQNETWTTTRQDKSLEVEILGLIRDRLQPTLTVPEPGPVSPDQP